MIVSGTELWLYARGFLVLLAALDVAEDAHDRISLDIVVVLCFGSVSWELVTGSASSFYVIHSADLKPDHGSASAIGQARSTRSTSSSILSLDEVS